MIVAAVRQVADWLSDATTGVNAQFATLPLESGDAAPDDVTVWDETRYEWVARGQILRAKTGDGPLLVVRGPAETELPTWAGDESGGWAAPEVMVAYVARPAATEPSDDARRDAYNTLRAAVRALQAPFQTMQAGPTRSSVTFQRPRITFDAAIEPLSGKETILAALRITLPAFDAWSMGAT